MADFGEVPGLRRLSTPRSAAVAGVLFALLFSVSLVMLRIAIPSGPRPGTAWLDRHGLQFHIGLTLMPLAGIAVLWFVGVVRDRIGALEDRFFSTVFFGSSLLFLAMVFVATAVAGALVYAAGADPGWVHASHVVYFGRAVTLQVGNIYALRMAAVLMISLATIWLRTRLMPRWLVAVSYILAAALLVVVSADPWVTLVFPAWVFLVSLMILRNK
ncbi:MAG: hypothetical protein ACXVXJ_04445 [Mycobacteriaceae bacterium]